MFGESPGGSRRTSEKKGGTVLRPSVNSLLTVTSSSADYRISASKSFDDGLDGDNLDDSKIASALK